ncbi:MORC family CW-type zinc finger protein 3a isoform X2 [Chaetodon auriga]|uniref:MORC family CW-type zinc finger protein 3a isoform X2 n=1 Tax=Chaetodon auriga TaxID=39042 RepID=UPI0040331096
MAAHSDRGVPFSTLCPKYLHTNSTSHTWPFSAIAELIDNAFDPDVNARQLWIDKTVVNGQECLSFMDNGNGLDHETMHKMLSFGYSDKTAVNGIEPIGMYGNGFKSGSMRLGKDAIVFSKSKSSSCVGMLSQTYLEEIGAQQIIVPIICLEQGETNKFSVRGEHKASLQDILSYSPFKTQEELLVEVDAISSSWSTEPHQTPTGTRIIIWNLRRTSTGTTEFDFETDRYDIRIPSDVYESMNDPSQHPGVTSYIPESVYSLRAYCSILYLKPRMQVMIRGQKVKTQLITKSLAYVAKDHYKPIFLSQRVPITFGYNTKSKDQYGVMMYHKNRLIKAYERVGCQLKANNKGVGVIGVIECNFLDPTHNKQSFMETDKYRKTMSSLAVKLEDYWKEIRHKRDTEDPNSIPVEDAMKRPDQNWVQCDECLKWRKLPDGIDVSKLPDKWYCHRNPDPQFRNCQVEQEPVDSDDDMRPSYRKTYKLQEKKDKQNREAKRQKDEEDRKRKEEQFLAELARTKQDLEQQQESLKRMQRQTPARSPSTPTTRRSRLNTESPKGDAASPKSTTISQAACSPSSSSDIPVISHVYSLSTGPLRGKRTKPATPQQTPKRPKVNGFHLGISDSSTPVDVSPRSSPSVPVIDDGDDDTDDDIFILETASTPKPQKPGFDCTKVKTEQEQSDVSMPMERSEDAALDATLEANVAGTVSPGLVDVGTSPCPAPPTTVATTTTQTEVPRVKKEEEDQSQTEGEERAGQSGKEQSSGVDINMCSEQRVIKQESSGDTGENQGKQTLQEGVTCHLDGEDDAGPSCADDKRGSPLHHPSMTDIQEQQDQLVELMQATAQERDSFKEQVHELRCQLQDMQSRLQELSQINVKKECSHQASQTEETQGEKDYKSLFEKAKQKVDELIKDKEALLAATETRPSAAQGEDTDEIALQVDGLLRELDQRNKERDELRSQLTSVEEERANLASQCEELRMSLQQQREEGSTTPHRAADSSVQSDRAAAGGTAASGTHSSSDASGSLIELRHNIGRLLVSFVPALDLCQVNYECNVIDEILEQVLSNMESATSVGSRVGALNK